MSGMQWYFDGKTQLKVNYQSFSNPDNTGQGWVHGYQSSIGTPYNYTVTTNGTFVALSNPVAYFDPLSGDLVGF